MFETEVFRKQMYYIEESNSDIVGIFGALRSDLAPPYIVTRRPGNYSPFPPSLVVTPLNAPINKKTFTCETVSHR